MLSNQQNKKLLLDTNIIEYSLNKNIGIPLNKDLLKLRLKGYSFYLSDFSAYELLKGADEEKTLKIFEIVKLFPRFQVSINVLNTAALFENLYKLQHKIEGQNDDYGKKRYTDVDKIIAATSCLENTDLLTADTNDYPRPYFKEVEWIKVFYTRKAKPCMLSVCLLRPDVVLIGRNLEKIYKFFKSIK